MTKDARLELGRYIAEQRESRELSKRGLAEASGIPLTSLHEIETGEKLASPEALQRIADSLGIDWEDLYHVAGYGRPKALPSFGPYLRSKYGDQLSPEAVANLEQHFRDVTSSAPTEDAP